MLKKYCVLIKSVVYLISIFVYLKYFIAYSQIIIQSNSKRHYIQSFYLSKRTYKIINLEDHKVHTW